MKHFFPLALVNAEEVHLVLLMRVQRFPVLRVTAVRRATTYLMTVCLRFCDSWAMINSPESQLLGRERERFCRVCQGIEADWHSRGVPHLLSSHTATLPKEVPVQGQSVRARTLCGFVRVCVCVHSPTPAAPLKPWWGAILAFRHILMEL